MGRLHIEITLYLICISSACTYLTLLGSHQIQLLVLVHAAMLSLLSLITLVSGVLSKRRIRIVASLVAADAWVTGIAGIILCGGGRSSSFILLGILSPFIVGEGTQRSYGVVLSIITMVTLLVVTAVLELNLIESNPLPRISDTIISQGVVAMFLHHICAVGTSKVEVFDVTPELPLPKQLENITTLGVSANLQTNPLIAKVPNSRVTVGAFSRPDELSSVVVVKRTLNWRRGDLIGQGAFGKVHIGLNLETGELMAVKNITFNSTHASCQRMRLLENEIRVMKPLNHLNIVRYFFTENTGSSINIFMEYVPGGSISRLIHTFGPLSETTVVQYTYQILNGLAHLHSKGIVHRDVKCANMLLTVAGRVKLADFGASVIVEEKVECVRDVQGTPYWMAPEVLTEAGHGWEADIWSTGCTVMEMLTGAHPWKHLSLNQTQVLRYIAGAAAIDISQLKISDASRTFLLGCLSRNPSKRPTALDLIKDHYFVDDTNPNSVKEVDSKKLGSLLATHLSSSTFSNSRGSIVSYDECSLAVHAGWRNTVLTADQKLRSSLLPLSTSSLPSVMLDASPNISSNSALCDVGLLPTGSSSLTVSSKQESSISVADQRNHSFISTNDSQTMPLPQLANLAMLDNLQFNSSATSEE